MPDKPSSSCDRVLPDDAICEQLIMQPGFRAGAAREWPVPADTAGRGHPGERPGRAVVGRGGGHGHRYRRQAGPRSRDRDLAIRCQWPCTTYTTPMAGARPAATFSPMTRAVTGPLQRRSLLQPMVWPLQCRAYPVGILRRCRSPSPKAAGQAAGPPSARRPPSARASRLPAGPCHRQLRWPLTDLRGTCGGPSGTSRDSAGDGQIRLAYATRPFGVDTRVPAGVDPGRQCRLTVLPASHNGLPRAAECLRP